jgi:hypothetical protein
VAGDAATRAATVHVFTHDVPSTGIMCLSKRIGAGASAKPRLKSDKRSGKRIPAPPARCSHARKRDHHGPRTWITRRSVG